MIILIPLGGIGNRFKDNGYTDPKALINVDGKCIIYHLLDNLKYIAAIDYIYIPYNKEYLDYDLETKLMKKYSNLNFKFYKLENNTQGAAETIKISLDNLNDEDKPILCLDADNFYINDIVSLWNGKNCVFTISDTLNDPIYSYVKCNGNEIIDIKEKDKISDFACTGAYGFKSFYQLNKYCKKIINNNIRQKSEFYTSGVIKEMINDNIEFTNLEIDNKYYFSLGTPKQVVEYENPFIFDLDGTLVSTDDIYISVWHDLMKQYNLSIDKNFFNFFIQGKNDIQFLYNFFPDINQDKINSISNLKDELFIKYTSKHNKDILVRGAKKFIETNKNRRLGIVTSCNKKAAEFILKKIGFDKYIQFLIASEDCVNHKPNKEPYSKAIDILGVNKQRCTIFEDSNSGYKSAKNLGGTNICLILNENSSNDIINANEYKIHSYNDFKFENLKNNSITDVKILIQENLKNLPIKEITINDDDLKTGYICDIKSFKLKLNSSTENIVLKIENDNNELSNVARKINLYNNEAIFYSKLASLVNVEVPKFYCEFKIDNKSVIVLENIHKFSGNFNLNLNDDLDTLLSVVKHILNMHNMFHFNNKNEIIPAMKDILKINQISYYQQLIDSKFNKFLEINRLLITEKDKNILNNIYFNYNNIINRLSKYPLNFCHGDLKSPNIFYKKELNDIVPIFLDWQYIHLNKGISDIVFLLIESTKYDQNINDLVVLYYYKKTNMYNNLSDLEFDFKLALCVFPFFVMVWFNSVDRDNLLDKVFPINFMKNTLKFYNYYLDKQFFQLLNN